MNSSPEPRVLRAGVRRSRVQLLDYAPIESFLNAEPQEPPLEQAPEPDEQVVVDLAASIEAAINAGFREGFEEGRAEGARAGAVEGRELGRIDIEIEARATAEAAFVADLRPTLRALDEAVAQLDAVDAVSLRDIETEIVDLAFSVVEALLGRELELSSSPTRESLRRCLLLAPDRGEVVARIHPDDLRNLEDIADLSPGRRVELVADPAIERGGSVVEVGSCRIDGQLGPALARVRAVLGASTPPRGDA
ncbi:MAG: Flagellar biosynthesis/type secretory pathway protein-like protein [Acidimicrobiia bacterium]|nr:Flagellar biosynthesis/type secretory pathway protein-like protein [Acidimicrobiia bacterium]